MRTKFKSTWIIFIMFTAFSGCLNEDNMPNGLTGSKKVFELAIPTPCNHQDSAFVYEKGVGNIYGMDGPLDYFISTSSDFPTVNIRFKASKAIIMLKVKNVENIKSLRNQIIDYKISGSTAPINFSITDLGIPSFGLFSAYSGKLYINNLENGDINFTWCDVQISNNNTRNLAATSGGITITP